MSAEAADGTPAIQWCHDPAQAEAVARLFVAHADPAYISHSELQFGRAAAPDRWNADLHAKISGEAARAIATTIRQDAPSGTRLAVLTASGQLQGFAFVSFTSGSGKPFATIEDLLIAPGARGQGTGRTVVDWICAECRGMGCERLFLESGIGNHRAHHFFEDQGFVQTSIVMMRGL